MNHVVHGTLPFAHAELAYVYRAPIGFVTPPNGCQNSGDGNIFCIDLGPDAQEIRVGDAVGQVRLAVGWQF